MSKNIVQIESITSEEFKKELITEISKALQSFATNLPPEDEEKLLSREETAKLLSISLVTLWNWTKNDILPAYRIGYKVRYKKSEVLQALKKMNQFNLKK